jgi:hypothetical protein
MFIVYFILWCKVSKLLNGQESYVLNGAIYVTKAVFCADDGLDLKPGNCSSIDEFNRKAFHHFLRAFRHFTKL